MKGVNRSLHSVNLFTLCCLLLLPLCYKLHSQNNRGIHFWSFYKLKYKNASITLEEISVFRWVEKSPDPEISERWNCWWRRIFFRKCAFKFFQKVLSKICSAKNVNLWVLYERRKSYNSNAISFRRKTYKQQKMQQSCNFAAGNSKVKDQNSFLFF